MGVDTSQEPSPKELANGYLNVVGWGATALLAGVDLDVSIRLFDIEARKRNEQWMAQGGSSIAIDPCAAPGDNDRFIMAQALVQIARDERFNRIKRQ